VAAWPGGARGALCLSFDNLGVDEATSAAAALPALLERLAKRDLSATFFVEGVNTELAPDALRAIAAAGHEVAYHAWLHEQWGDLSAAEQAENLARGVAAFAELGIELSGLRPPGGQLGADGIAVLRESDLGYASPAGQGAGIEEGVALLPFPWRHVDATSMLPGLDPVREQMTGSPEPLDGDAFTGYLCEQIDLLERDGGFVTIVLHLPLLAWLGKRNLTALLERLRDAGGSGDLWLARCDELAGHVLANPANFEAGATLDPTTWST